MAAPETQFQPGGMGIGYQSSFEPLRLNPPIQLPDKTGQLYAELGRTMMTALPQMIQNSAINPAVRAQMREAYARAQVGSQISEYAATHPKWRRALGSESPAGASLAAPATLPVSQSTNWDLDQDPDNPPPPPAPPAPTQPTEPTQPTKEAKPKSHQEEMGQVSSPGSTQIAQTSNVNPNLGASTDLDFYLNRMRWERQAAGLGGSEAAQEGTPASMTFLNPATGNVQPYQTGPPPQQPAAQTTPSPSMFAGKAATPPAAAPSGPGQAQPPAQPSTPGTVPGSLSDQYAQQQLAQWQNQNVHPVVSPQAFLAAYKQNVTTKAIDATYMQAAGPGGSPAFQVDLKGGGSTMVPISQVAKTSWGAGLVAAHNGTEALEAQNQQGATPMPSGTGAGAPQGPPGAPSAPSAMGPTPMPSGTGAGAPQGPPAAPGPQAYNPAAYQQMVATAMAQPGNLMAQEGPQAGVRSTDPAAAAAPPQAPPERTQAETRYASPQTVQIPTTPEQIKEVNTDTKRIWHPDDTGRFPGTSFTTKPSGRAGFYEQRYYRGSPGWEDGLWTPENQKRQEVLDTYGSAASGIPRSDVLDFDQVKAKTMPEIDALLAKAVWWKTHNLPMDQADQNRLNAESNASKAYQTLLDMSKWVQENKGDPKDFTNNSILQAFEAATRDGVMTQEEGNNMIKSVVGPFFHPWKFGQYAYHDAFSGFQPQHPFSFAVGSKIQDLTKALSLLPEYGERAQGEYDWPTHTLGINIPQWHIDLGAPVVTNPSKIPEINSMVTGATPEAATRNYTEMKRRVDEQYVKDVQNYAYGSKRVPQADIDNMTELSKPNGKIKDDNNPMRDRTTGKLINPYDPSHYVGPTASPPPATASPAPTPSPQPSRTTPITGTGSFTASRSTNANASPTPMQTVDPTDSNAIDQFLKQNPQGGMIQFGTDANGNPKTFRVKPK
jgi:hypothetical protein